MRNYSWDLFLVVLLVLFCATPARSAFIVVQNLTFGSFISKNNNAQYDITVNTNATYSYDAAGFIIISNPTPGVYDITGLPPSMAIASVTVAQNAPLNAPGGQLQMLNFTETHPAATDVAGVARITIGATCRTSGNMMAYPDNTYTGSVDITVNF